MTSIELYRPAVLAISGLDPTGSAGLIADVRTIAALKCHPCGAASCLTVQSSVELIEVHPVDAVILDRQLSAIFADIEISAIKIGAMGSVETIDIIKSHLKMHPNVPAVVDPVFRATKGKGFLDSDGVLIFLQKILPHAIIATPNLDELAALSEKDFHGVDDDSISELAVALIEKGCKNILVTGLRRENLMVDWLFSKSNDGIIRVDFAHEFHAVEDVHGTGCVLSSAVASRLAHGDTIEEACRAAAEFTSMVIANARKYGKGAPFWVESQ